MDCESVRRLLEDDDTDPRVTAHLDGCAECRAEAAFARRLHTAISAMPRAQAPAGFAPRVMAAVRQRNDAVQPAPLPFALRPWEIGGLVALCVTLLALTPAALDRWTSWGSGTGVTATSTWLQDGWRALLGLWQAAGEQAAAWSGVSANVLIGAAGFALALYLLLGWWPNGARRHGVEDAHAS